MMEEPAAKQSDKRDLSPSPFERFLVNRPICACCTFFWISILMTVITIMLLRGGVLVFDSRGVWDVRDDLSVTRRDAFAQAQNNVGEKLMCSDGGGPPRPCEAEGPNETFARRSQTIDSIVVFYEATEDGGEDMLSPGNLKYVKEFETEILAMTEYEDKCVLSCAKEFQVSGSRAKGTCTATSSCGAIDSIANLAFPSTTLQSAAMQSCYVDSPYCNVGDTTAPCMNTSTPCANVGVTCGEGSTPFGTAPCHSSKQTAFSDSVVDFGILCTPEATETDTAAVKKKALTWKSTRTKYLPGDYKCSGANSLASSKHVKTSFGMGAPLKGFSTDQKKEECSSAECIAEWGKQANGDPKKQEDVYKDWFAKTMWPLLDSSRASVVSNSEGNVKIYPGCGMAMSTLFLGIMQNDGTLALASLVFVLLWIWTATGSFFLAMCGCYECFISLFQAMLTWALFGKYIGFLAVMMIFVILGIGADDIFVLLDAYKQSAYEPPEISEDPTKRFVWAYRRSRNAMFVTTATTCVCFLAAGFSEVPSISAFGFFGAFVVAWDYIMVITFFAAATSIYSQHFEGKKGGHMCIDAKCGSCSCCCLRLCLPFNRPCGPAAGWRGYTVLIVVAAILVILGVLIIVVGSVRELNFVPLLGTALICAAAILTQGVLNAPEDRQKARTMEVWFGDTFFTVVSRHAKKMLVFWTVTLLACAVIVGVQMKVADEAPLFIREDHPLMKFISISSSFGGMAGRSRIPVLFVMGIDSEEPLDRAGVDAQTPGGGEYKLGEVKYSPTASSVASTPAGQQAILDFCRALERAPDSLVQKDAGCQTAFHAETNPTMRLASIGGKVGHCQTGVYCFMDTVYDYLEAHCRPCAIGQVEGCNVERTPNNPCRNADNSTTMVGFPTPDLHQVLRSTDFEAYEESLKEVRQNAAHGFENRKRGGMTGYFYDQDNWFAFIGMNTTVDIRRRPNEEKGTLHEKYENLATQMTAIPDMYMMSEGFVWWVTENALFVNTYQSFIVALVFSWIVLVLTTWNWWLGSLGLLSVIAVVIAFLALILLGGWTLGVIEAIALLVIVGLSVDYSIHLAHAYNEAAFTYSDRKSKAKAAISSMGISLVGGMATTSGAALFLFFCNITFFRRFGQALLVIVLMSLLIAFTFLMPLLIVIGPEGSSGYLPACRFCKRNEKTDS